ncbi:hypothetical protein EMPG_09291 [Blastomyces silverae]|uniref:Partial AB-hydrolase lipase domain-containing protein n=1 Tax=Blastomyces silverae TaxID=2060906 RepID=A0A0H1B5Q7_9EURO|nr:hypothetical protein EMPG_09291 [Blastomyces silverae]
MKTADVNDASGASAFKGTEDIITIAPSSAARPAPTAVDAEKPCASASASSCPSGSGSEKSISITALPPIIDENPHPHHPLFPPLPEYKPPSSIFTAIQWRALRAVSFCLSLAFLIGVVLAASVSSSLIAAKGLSIRLRGGDPEKDGRPFWQEECKRRDARESAARAWDDEKRKQAARASVPRSAVDAEERSVGMGKAPYEPLEGGQDPLVCDISYYARRVGLDAESYRVQTEDGAVIILWHLYNPKEYTPLPSGNRDCIGPPSALQTPKADGQSHPANGDRKYPVLMLPGLLQSAGAFCANDDDSLAFFLAKSGYDIWLGSNRYGFHPEHISLAPSDPRFWSWTIRDMAAFDLPALIARVLYETQFTKLALIGHSQGTAETFIALSKDIRPSLGSQISIFCALAPAAYSGPLLNKPYLKFMRLIPATCFRLVFGIHAFIPFILTLNTFLPAVLYGSLGYMVFSYLFKWSDTRWDRGLRPRFFQFSPIYASAECMRWWLGKGGFADHGCILNTREELARENAEDARHDAKVTEKGGEGEASAIGLPLSTDADADVANGAWYDDRVPPMALWVAGSDQLIDGSRLLRRLKGKREPYVRVVYSKVIEEYEHLDVIWAIDSIEKVGMEVRRVIWECVKEDARGICRTPEV